MEKKEAPEQAKLLFEGKQRTKNSMELNVVDRKKITSRFAAGKHRAVDAFFTAVTASFALIKRNGEFALAFIMTATFYFPALKNGSVDAGFLYMGDPIGFYWPVLAKMHTLISSLNLMAIDFSSFNGSSDYFLATNSYGYHPMIMIYSLLVPANTTTLKDLGHFLVWMLALHSFLACYFSLRLLTRFFSFDLGAAGLAATIFAFSVMMVNGHGEPGILFATSIFPWAAYEALVYCERPQLRRLVFACLPVIFGFMGGYLPMAVASLALSVFLVAVKILVLDDLVVSLNERARAFSVALFPFVCGTLLVGPYLYSAYKFFEETPSSGTASLFYSAHQLAEQPQTLIRLLSVHFSVPGPFYEFSLTWGFIAVTIAAIFILSPKAIDAVTSQEWKIFKISALIYFATVLAIFGEYSVVSDLVYYFVPQVGKMHIYQRFLLPTHLLFGVMVALMLKAVVHVRPPVTSRVAVTLLAIVTFVVAYLVGRNPVLSQEIGLNNYITFELFLAFLFACALLIPAKVFICSVTIVLFCLPSLDRMYDYSHGGNILQEQQKQHKVILDETERAHLVSYFKRFSDKEIIKYVDLTPRWNKEGIETFPKSFPYFVLNELRLSSYTGFNFYLSARADYMRKMPIQGADVVLSPNWDMVDNSGADFVIARESDVGGGPLGALFAKAKKEDLYRLANDVIIFPLRAQAEKTPSSPAVFDNGYFRVFPTRRATDKLENIALGKTARQSSTFGAGDARLAIDGKTDGNYDHGSVTHTGRDPNAWLEIDLGSVETIDRVRVWNRTDCCEIRLHDHWIFISKVPFSASDTASVLRTRPATWSKANFTPNPKSTIKTGGIRGRYVRVQLGGTQPIDESFLSLAEVEVFGSDKSPVAASTPASNNASEFKVREFFTNNANYLRLDLESSTPATIQYLFWDNPRLNYYLNGQRAMVIDQDGLRAIEIPAGRNILEIRYRHWPLIAFLILYAIYGIAYVWALTTSLIQAGVWSRCFRRAGR